jgi:hypothetical protein
MKIVDRAAQTALAERLFIQFVGDLLSGPAGIDSIETWIVRRARAMVEEVFKQQPSLVPYMEAPEPNADVRHLVMSGRKIQAIEEYRKQTGLGLRDSKDVVDDLLQSYNNLLGLLGYGPVEYRAEPEPESGRGSKI